MSITHATTLGINLVYTQTLDDIKEAVFLPDKRSYKDLGIYFSLGIPSALMLLLEVGSYSSINFCTGYMGVDT